MVVFSWCSVIGFFSFPEVVRRRSTTLPRSSPLLFRSSLWYIPDMPLWSNAASAEFRAGRFALRRVAGDEVTDGVQAHAAALADLDVRQLARLHQLVDLGARDPQQLGDLHHLQAAEVVRFVRQHCANSQYVDTCPDDCDDSRCLDSAQVIDIWIMRKQWQNRNGPPGR